jgi:hypothetical protein
MDIVASTVSTPSIPWLQTTCGEVAIPLSPSTNQLTYTCELTAIGSALANISDGSELSGFVRLKPTGSRLAPTDGAELVMNVSVKVTSHPSCTKSFVRWPASVNAASKVAVFKHDDTILVGAEAFDVGGLEMNTSISQFVLTWEHAGQVSEAAFVRNATQPSQYSAAMSQSSIATPGSYRLTVSLEGAWNESSAALAQSCVLGSTTVNIACADGYAASSETGACIDSNKDLCGKANSTFVDQNAVSTVVGQLGDFAVLNDSSAINITEASSDNVTVKFIPLQNVIEVASSPAHTSSQRLSRTGKYDVYLKTTYHECRLLRDLQVRCRPGYEEKDGLGSTCQRLCEKTELKTVDGVCKTPQFSVKVATAALKTTIMKPDELLSPAAEPSTHDLQFGLSDNFDVLTWALDRVDSSVHSIDGTLTSASGTYSALPKWLSIPPSGMMGEHHRNNTAINISFNATNYSHGERLSAVLSFSARGANNVSAKETQTVKIDGTLSAVPSLKRSSWELKIDGAVCATSVSVTWTQCQMTRSQKLTFEVTAKDTDLLPVHRSDASISILVAPSGYGSNLTTQPATYENRSGVSIYTVQYQPLKEGEHLLYITDVFGIKVRLLGRSARSNDPLSIYHVFQARSCACARKACVTTFRAHTGNLYSD